ncbi:Endoplasmic reticulum metallopeptidase 1 [Geranomyces variabilis]|nr:Endoplasmic reticulum metallopeptidase 1 [Geranomyces variabilis]
MANSDRNDFVRRFIAEELGSLKIYGEDRGHSVDLLLDDPVNMFVRPVYWQSNNVALRINANKNSVGSLRQRTARPWRHRQRHRSCCHARNLAAVIPSETDATVYGTWGGLPGIDLAFYTRGLYHSQFDDVAHVSPRSVQQMGDNLLQNVRYFCAQDVAELRVQQSTTGFGETDFVYAEVRGLGMFAVSAQTYRFAILALLIFILSTACATVAWSFRTAANTFKIASMLPFVNACIVVSLSLMLPPVVVFLLSWLKTWANYGSTYGHQVLNFAWIAPTVILVVLVVLHLVAPRIQLGVAAETETLYTPTVDSESFEHDGMSALDIEDEEAEVVDTNGEEINSEPSRRIEDTHERQIFSSTWTSYAVLALDTCGLCLALLLSHAGKQSGFIILELAFWSVLAIIVNAAFALAPRFAPTDSTYAAVLVCFSERWSWFLSLCLGATVPLFRQTDMIYLAVTGFLPATIAGGLAEGVLDVMLAAQVTPALTPTLSTLRCVPRRALKLSIALLGTAAVAVYILASYRFPFSSHWPVHVMYNEVWDVTSAQIANSSSFMLRTDSVFSTAKLGELARSRGVRGLDCSSVPDRCVYRDAPTPVIHAAKNSSQVLDWSNVMQIAFDVHAATKSGSRIVVRGNFTGLRGSRTCTFSAIGAEDVYDADAQIELSLRPRAVDGSGWINKDGSPHDMQHPLADASRSCPVVKALTLYSRAATDVANRTVSADFSVTYRTGIPPPTLQLLCRIDETGISRARSLVDGVLIGGWLGWYGWWGGQDWDVLHGGLAVLKKVQGL